MRTLNLAVPKPYELYIRVGTCSWKYDSWRGLLYKPGVKCAAADYLRDYAKHLRTVEVDQWFWSLFPGGVRLPDEATVKAYAESVPDDFIFTVKAPNSITLTHYYSKQSKRYQEFANKPNEHFLSTDLLQRFLDALAPLGKKLGPIMFQFEYLNKQKMPSLAAFLDKLHEFFSLAPAGYHYAIETRNPNYLKSAFFDFLREHGVGYVFMDGYYMPGIGQVSKANDAVTAPFSVIRLQGGGREEIEERTGQAWDKIVEPRDEGLGAVVAIVRRNVGLRIVTFVSANNHYEGSAPLTIERFLSALVRSASGAG